MSERKDKNLSYEITYQKISIQCFLINGIFTGEDQVTTALFHKAKPENKCIIVPIV